MYIDIVYRYIQFRYIVYYIDRTYIDTLSLKYTIYNIDTMHIDTIYIEFR